MKKNVFRKADILEWSDEFYGIIFFFTLPPTFKLIDCDCEDIDKQFCEDELLQVVKRNSADIKSILKVRNRYGVSEHKVEWKRYMNKRNSWINLV